MEIKRFYRKSIHIDTFYQMIIVMNLIEQANKLKKNINLRQILKTNYGFTEEILDREVRSLSNKLKDFEEMFSTELNHSKMNLKLIQKSISNKSYKLTNQGEKILPYLMKIKSCLDDIISILEENEQTKRIRISSIESLLIKIVPNIIKEYTEIHKNTMFDVMNCFSMSALKGLEELDNDIAFIVRNNNRKSNDPNLKYYISNFHDYPVCICSSHVKDKIDQLPFISFVEGTSWHEKVNLWLKEKSIKTSGNSFNANSFDTILSLVNNRIGWSIVPGSVLYGQDNHFNCQTVKNSYSNIEIFDEWMERDKDSNVYVVTRKDNPYYITEFIDFLVKKKYIVPVV